MTLQVGLFRCRCRLALLAVLSEELVSERWGVEYCEQKIACGHEVPADEASLASLYTGAQQHQDRTADR